MYVMEYIVAEASFDKMRGIMLSAATNEELFRRICPAVHGGKVSL